MSLNFCQIPLPTTELGALEHFFFIFFGGGGGVGGGGGYIQ